MLILIYR